MEWGRGGGAYQHDCKIIKDTKYMYYITKLGLNTEPPHNNRIVYALPNSVDPVEMPHYAHFNWVFIFAKEHIRSH